ncbi:MAG: ATP-dependent Clp protease ATP-binding subunit [Firmicutes bacterium]|jgi:ATP-dependent Clp protease ATP-binding subunit ClpC|nr:ATP-dependent Clp protease ATP-binding subunit [Bacillota bacterium]
MQRKYTKKAQAVLQLAQESALKLGNRFIGTEHILLGLTLVRDSVACKALEEQGITSDTVFEKITTLISRSSISYIPQDFTPGAKRVLEFSNQEAQHMGTGYIGTEHLLLSLIKEVDSIAVKILIIMGVNAQKLYEDIMMMLGESESQIIPGMGYRSEVSNEKTVTENLDKYGRNLTNLAKDNKFDPIIGREREIERIIQILSRRTKNSPCLVGDPGVGKTAIVEGLAQKVAEGNIPSTLKDKKIISLDLSSMVAGSKYRGEFEERMKKSLKEVQNDGNIILFIDEIHTIIGAGAAEGAIDASNILKPLLARGEIQLIGATTLEEYRKYIEKDAAFERRFQPVKVEEPEEEKAISMLKGLKDRYEVHHNVTITDDAIESSVKMSIRYLPDRFLPDKAIDLIDEAASSLRLKSVTMPLNIKELEEKLEEAEKEKEEAIKTEEFEKASEIKKQQTEIKKQLDEAKKTWEQNNKQNEQTITREDIADVISKWTGIPVKSLEEEESQKLLHMEEELHKRVIGQEEAVSSIAKAVRRGRVGLKDPNRPIGSFLFLGPTGVGKTELSKALAEVLFGDETAMIRIDMSEYMEKHSVSRMIGSPPGYVGYEEGGQLSEKVRQNPYSVILFDEIEKASSDVFNILLQVLDDGHITDGHGRKIDFKNTVIIMTSNAGAKNIIAPKKLGFITVDTEEQNYEIMKKSVMEEVKQIFKPEFLNRIDDIIVFHTLNQENMKQIVTLMSKTVVARAKENMKIDLTFSEEAISLIALEGYDQSYGARPLRRAIQSKIENFFAEQYLEGKFKEGDMVQIDVENEDFVLQKVEKNN